MAIVYHQCMIPIHSRGNVHTINYDLGIRGICTEWQGNKNIYQQSQIFQCTYMN